MLPWQAKFLWRKKVHVELREWNTFRVYNDSHKYDDLAQNESVNASLPINKCKNYHRRGPDNKAHNFSHFKAE